MATKKLLYSDRKSAEIVMELPDYAGAFTIVSQFTRKDRGIGKMAKPPKGKVFDPEDEDTRIFNLIQLGDDKEHLYCVEIAKLNSCKGFKDVIVVSDNRMIIHDGAQVAISGGEAVFSIAA